MSTTNELTPRQRAEEAHAHWKQATIAVDTVHAAYTRTLYAGTPEATRTDAAGAYHAAQEAVISAYQEKRTADAADAYASRAQAAAISYREKLAADAMIDAILDAASRRTRKAENRRRR